MVKLIVFQNSARDAVSVCRPNYDGAKTGIRANLTDDEFCHIVAQRSLANVAIQSGAIAAGIGEVDDPRLATEVLPNIPAEFTAGKDYYLIEENRIPPELFRDAWEIRQGRISTDMSKARGIHMDRIRRVRDIELQKLDIEFSKALGSRNTAMQARIFEEQRRLRDIPQTFDLTTDPDTPSALMALWPENLARG